MNIILTMSLSGSCMFVLYLIIKQFGRERITRRWSYILLKLSLFYFLIPLPFLKILYNKIAQKYYAPNNTEYFFSALNSEVMIANNKIYLNYSYKQELLVFAIWIFVTIIIFIWKLVSYLNFRNNIFMCSKVSKDEKTLALLEKIRKEYRVRRDIKLIIFDEGISPFTIGIWKPTIVVKKSDSLTSLEYIIRHEMIHIKRLDALVNMCIILVRCIHWFNPMVYVMKHELENLCEISCDEVLINKLTIEECEHYAKLIISQSCFEKSQPRWAISLSSVNTNIEERVTNIMIKNKKKFSNIALAIISVLAFLISSISVFAYDDVAIKRCEVDSEFTSKDIKEMLLGDECFVPEGEVGGFATEFPDVIYDKQFTDQEGKVYQIEQSLDSYILCSHSYQSGIVQRHYKNSDGSCKVIYYNGRRCTKCGEIRYDSQINELTYKVCQH